jgi:hypothetical protein
MREAAIRSGRRNLENAAKNRKKEDENPVKRKVKQYKLRLAMGITRTMDHTSSRQNV